MCISFYPFFSYFNDSVVPNVNLFGNGWLTYTFIWYLIAKTCSLLCLQTRRIVRMLHKCKSDTKFNFDLTSPPYPGISDCLCQHLQVLFPAVCATTISHPMMMITWVCFLVAGLPCGQPDKLAAKVSGAKGKNTHTHILLFLWVYLHTPLCAQIV